MGVPQGTLNFDPIGKLKTPDLRIIWWLPLVHDGIPVLHGTYYFVHLSTINKGANQKPWPAPRLENTMPFQRKGVVIGSAHRPPSKSSSQISDRALPGGVRPSPLDGRPTTSTGTASLDRFFGGHNGLPLGTSVLVEETGATDFAGVVARYYAAEGLVQGHHVHVIGYGDAWKADLPGLTSSDGSVTSSRQSKGDAMKIAWRYERLDNGMSRKGGT